MNQKTRKMMTMRKPLHPKNEIDRLYMSRKRSRGLDSIKDCINTTVRGQKDFIKKRKERLIIAASNSIGKIRQGRKTTRTGK